MSQVKKNDLEPIAFGSDFNSTIVSYLGETARFYKKAPTNPYRDALIGMKAQIEEELERFEAHE